MSIASPRAAYLNGDMEYEEYKTMNEYETLNLGQKAAVDEMVKLCRETGRVSRDYPDLVAEIYAYPHQGGVAWGINSLNTGENMKRGIVE